MYLLGHRSLGCLRGLQIFHTPDFDQTLWPIKLQSALYGQLIRGVAYSEQ